MERLEVKRSLHSWSVRQWEGRTRAATLRSHGGSANCAWCEREGGRATAALTVPCWCRLTQSDCWARSRRHWFWSTISFFTNDSSWNISATLEGSDLKVETDIHGSLRMNHTDLIFPSCHHLYWIDWHHGSAHFPIPSLVISQRLGQYLISRTNSSYMQSTRKLR